jgi:hypothetical protein
MGELIPFIILLLVLLAVISVLMIGYCKETKGIIIANIIAIIIYFLFLFSLMFTLTTAGYQEDANVVLVLGLFLFSLSDFLDMNPRE